MNETNSLNIVKTDDPTGCGIPDEKANDENGSLECHDCVIPYEGAKEYLLKHRPVALPRRFLPGITYGNHRIECLAATFIHRPSYTWRGNLSDWDCKVLSECFGLKMTHLPNRRHRACEKRRPFPEWARNRVELLEDLWEMEYQTALGLLKLSDLYCEEKQRSHPGVINTSAKELKQDMKAIRFLLLRILRYEYLLIQSIVWPHDQKIRASIQRIAASGTWWSGLVYAPQIPKWILDRRLQGAFAIAHEERERNVG